MGVIATCSFIGLSPFIYYFVLFTRVVNNTKADKIHAFVIHEFTIINLRLPDERPTLETLDFAFYIGSTLTF